MMSDSSADEVKHQYSWGEVVTEKNNFSLYREKYIDVDNAKTFSFFKVFLCTAVFVLGITIVDNWHSPLGFIVGITITILGLMGDLFALRDTEQLDKIDSFTLINTTFENSLTKQALDKGTSYTALKEWEKLEHYLQKCENAYRSALIYGNIDEAETLKAAFQVTLPSVNDENFRDFKDVLDEVMEQSRIKIEKKIAEKNKKVRQEREVERAKIKKQIEARKPGLQITDGSYAWNPNEVINVGELR